MCGSEQNPFYKSSCAPIRENFGTVKFIFHVHVLTRENSRQYCCIRRRYYFTRIWKILHWKYHRDICKEHSQDISLSCHIVEYFAYTCKGYDLEHEIFLTRKILSLFYAECCVSGRKSTPILSASARSSNNTFWHNFTIWRKETKKTN